MQQREPRVPTSFRVRYASMDDLVVAYSGNLSRGGLFLKSDELLPVGTVVSITLELPDGGPEIAVPCTVVFTRDTGLRGMGVKFNDHDEETKNRIEQFIIGAAPSSPSSMPPSERRVLDIVVVDDDPIQSKRAADAFRERGDTVRTARDGLEGLALCLKKSPDAVLTDVQMPKMDGWQLVRMLRARPAFAGMPIIFLTTLSSETDRLLGYRIGVDDYLPKPYDTAELVSRVQSAVKRAARHGQAAGSDKARSLSGDLEQVGMPSILAFLEVERRSGELSVGSDVTGRIVLREGRPVRAELSQKSEKSTGRQAFFGLLDVASGRFDFHEGELEAEPDEIGAGVSALLLEHARLRDEQPAV